jgi:hypothetical protein
MGRHHSNQEAATEERINRRRSTTHDADEDVQELKGQAKAKGRDLDTKAGNAKQDAKDVAHDLKSKAKEKGRDAEDTAQDLKEDAKDTAASAQEKGRELKEDAKDTARDAKETAHDKAGDAKDKAGEVLAQAQDKANDAKEDAKGKVTEVKEQLQQRAGQVQAAVTDAVETVKHTAQMTVEKIKEGAVAVGTAAVEKKNALFGNTVEARDKAAEVLDQAKGKAASAKGKGRELKETTKGKAFDAKETAKGKAHDAKEKTKQKGREGANAAQGWAGTAMDKAHHAKEVISRQTIHARDVFMNRTRTLRTGARSAFGGAKNVLRRSAHGARVAASRVLHPSLTAKTGFILLAATIATIALLMGAHTVSKRRHLSTFERAKEAVFGRPSMVEEAKDMASDALKTVKGTTDKVFDAAHYAKVKGEGAVKKGLEIGEDATDIAGGVLDASWKIASKLATNAFEYVKEKADHAKDAAGEAIHKLAKDARV